MRDARVRRSLLDREQRAARVFDAIPRSHLHEEGAGAGAGVRPGHGDHHADGLVRRASAQKSVVHQVLGAGPGFALSQEGHAHVSLESLRDGRGRSHVEKSDGVFGHRNGRYLASTQAQGYGWSRCAGLIFFFFVWRIPDSFQTVSNSRTII